MRCEVLILPESINACGKEQDLDGQERTCLALHLVRPCSKAAPLYCRQPGLLSLQEQHTQGCLAMRPLCPKLRSCPFDAPELATQDWCEPLLEIFVAHNVAVPGLPSL